MEFGDLFTFFGSIVYFHDYEIKKVHLPKESDIFYLS